MAIRRSAVVFIRRRAEVVATIGALGAVAIGGAACTSESSNGGTTSGPAAANATSRPLDYVNGGFESGTGAAIASWTETSYTNAGIPTASFPPQTFTDLALGMATLDGNTPIDHTSSVGALVVQSVTATNLTVGASLKYPFSGSNSAAINISGNDHSANLLETTFTVVASDFDPSDGLVHVRFVAAPVLQDATSAGHTGPEQPYFFVELGSAGTPIFHTYNFANQSGVTWIADSNETANLTYYTNWTAFDVSPGSGAIRLGDVVDTKLVGSGCYKQAHFGELYADAFSTTTFPVPLVQAVGPAYANLGTNITYTVTAKNPSASPQTAVTVDFTLPYLVGTKTGTATPAATQTTLVTPLTLPAGATCTGPDATGKLVCTLPSLSPRASFSFPLTVTIPATNPAGDTGPYTINEGTYDIHTAQDTTPLNGSVVTTTVGTNVPVDLHATLTDGTLVVGSGTPDTYTFTVTNNGTTTVTSPITDTQPAGFAITACSAMVTTNCGWTCTATGGATCTAPASGAGVATVSTSATLPAKGSVTYTVYAKSTATTGSYSTYTMTAGIPTGDSETIAFDNVASDTDYVNPTTYAFTATKTGGNGDGLITANPGNVRCDVGCTAGISALYGSGEQIAVWAVPALGDTFAGWTSGACIGTTTVPCLTTVTAATTMNAKFVAPTLATSIASTSNGTSTTTVRPGDTELATLTVTVPSGQNAPLVITDTLGSGLSLGSVSSTQTTNLPTCSTSVLCAPTVATNGNVNTWDYGVVTCTNANGCIFTISEIAKVATDTTAVRGDVLTQMMTASGGATGTASTTVVEPNLTVAHSETATAAVTPGSTDTISVTVANDTGGSNSDAYDAVVVSPFPAGTTAQNFSAGTCTGATAAGLGAGSAMSTVTVTFPAATAYSDTSTCTYTYDLVVTAGATAGNLSVGADTATSRSTGGATYKTYTATDTALVLDVLYPVGHACTAGTMCLDGICDPKDSECGYANGDGPCTTADAATTCQSGSCSASGVCKVAARCAADDDCTTAQFCDTTAGVGDGTCTPKLDNGVAIPTVPNHTPTLTALCTTSSGSGSVGASVCSSGVCDPTDNKCGLPNGTLPAGTSCTVSTDPTALTECRAGFCITATGSANVGRCEPCVDDTTTKCASPTAACDTTTNQCVACTTTNTTACTGTTPVCNTTTQTCAACNGDNGSGTTLACGATAPYCNTTPATGGSCSSSCFVDTDCGTADWCDAGACTQKLVNGTPIPTVGNHTPALTGACSTAVAGAICVSGVCDATGNTCGYNLGDGPCATSTQCTTGACITSGANATKCESCTDDSTCGGATPVCNTATGSCAQCDATNTSVCTGTTPICNTSTDSCGACNGDYGSTATAACPKTSPNCGASGSCTSSCSMDSECGSNDWCDAGTCAAKLANGTAIPTVGDHSPALVGACSATVATAVCQSGVCDTKTNDCGYALGDGPCTESSQCVSGICAPGGATMVCTPSVVENPDGGAEAGTPDNNNVTVLGGGCAVGSSRGDCSDGALFGMTFAALAFLGARRRKNGARS